MRKKALMALLFAGGLLNQTLTALSQNTNESADSIISKIATDSKNPAEVKAYFLLRIAELALSGGTSKNVQTNFGNAEALQAANFAIHRREGVILSRWADQAAMAGHKKSDADAKSKAIASKSLEKVVPLLDKVSAPWDKLNLCLIASHLFERLGNAEGVKQCDKILDDSLNQCEKNPNVTAEEARAAISVLLSRSCEYIPIRISESYTVRERPQDRISFTAENLNKAEALQLRAAAIGDRLHKDADLRRRVHRDLALWYTLVDKKALAEKQKETLYELVGIKNEKILYPMSGDCGHLVWWTLTQPVSSIDCGMG